MKAVMPQVPPDIIEWRKRTGAHQWDEMWEGVLHMPPSPNREPRVYFLHENEYRQQAAADDGSISSNTTGILLRGQPDGKLVIQLAGEAQTRRQLPEG